MPIQETFSLQFANYLSWRLNRDKDRQAVNWMSKLVDNVGRCKNAGVTYGLGSWGYTVLRTAYSDEADTLWPVAMDRLKLWVTRYFVHYTRLIDGKPDPSANEDMASRFALDVLDDANTVLGIKALNLPDDLSRASQEDIRALTRIFDAWAEGVLSNTKCGVRYEDGDIIFSRGDNPRFCDFLVIDEAALRSLATLPDETPPLDIVPREERLARTALYGEAYVWLVDSEAVRSFVRFEHVQADCAMVDWENRCHNGWLKREAMGLDDAWFERLARFQDEHYVFCRRERRKGSGDWWFEPS